MPKLTKKVISDYFRTDCERFLALSLYRFDPLKATYSMPEPIVARKSQHILSQPGKKAEELIYKLLSEEFGHAVVNFREEKSKNFKQVLEEGIADKLFLCEATYVTEGFMKDFFMGLGVDIATFQDNLEMREMRPDLIIKLTDSNKTYFEVLTNGTLKAIDENDTRTKLAIVDIKYTEQSNSGYDAEVVLYAMMLSLWLSKNNLADKYVITSDVGILPGVLHVNAFTEEYKPLYGQTVDEKYASFFNLISFVEFDQLAITVKKVLQEDLVKILQAPNEWETLHWHVGQKCGMCDWLAFEKWLSEDDKKLITPQHCHKFSDDNDSICKIPFVSRGMTGVLNDASFTTVESIANTTGDETVYAEHTGLKKNSSILPKRAKALNGEPSIEGRAILSMPKYAYTNLCITTNFDPSTGILSSIGLYAYWMEYSNFDDRDQYNKSQKWNEQFFTNEPTDASEFDMLGRFMSRLNDILTFANDKKNNTHPEFDNKTIKHSQNFQVYFWDQVQFERIQKAVGKHLGSILQNTNFRALIWMFPPDELLEDPFKVMSQPITFVKDILRQNIALKVPYEYTLFNVAESYLDNPGSFNFISKAFYDPFSDAIPKDRLYEIWQKTSRPNYQEVMSKYMEITKKQALALYLIALKVRSDLYPYLQGEPNRLDFSVFQEFKDITRWPNDSQLWYLYELLNEKYTALESNLIASTPAVELEASYKAIILEHRLTPEEKQTAISVYFPALTASSVEIYTVTEESKNSKIKDNASYLLFGYRHQEGLLKQKLFRLATENGIDPMKYGDRRFSSMKTFLQADIKAFDRVNGLIAINFRRKNDIKEFVTDRILNINSNLCLMDISTYSSADNTKEYLKQIKNPNIAHPDPKSIASLGITKPKAPGKDQVYTISRLLWAADGLSHSASDVTSDAAAEVLENILDQAGEEINDSQKNAIVQSLIKQLSIIWGPPGTGKTKTASFLLASRIEASLANNGSIRILLTAPTYQACIELFERAAPYIRNNPMVRIFALQSASRNDFDQLHHSMETAIANFALFKGNEQIDNPSYTTDALRNELNNNTFTGATIVLAANATLDSFYKSIQDGKKKLPFKGIGQCFDFVMLDEASQVDVTSSLSVMYGLTDAGQFVLLGDHLQMPPIHKMPPPVGVEFMVGSILEYLRGRFRIEPSMLNINYRSCKKIVDFIKTVGYGDLSAAKTTITIPFLASPRGINPFEINNDQLFPLMIDQSKETMAITYEDGRSSQANDFEATLVAGAIMEAYNNFEGEGSDFDEWFWKKGIGVVTPHKAQKVAVARKLYGVFPKELHKMIDEAIDTVERFQGGQRKMILVSFGVGDPDIIAQEEEFLLDLNRTNVAISRAEAKVVVFISENLIHHLPQDKEIIKTAKAIKSYTHQYCNHKEQQTVAYQSKQKVLNVRYR